MMTGEFRSVIMDLPIHVFDDIWSYRLFFGSQVESLKRQLVEFSALLPVPILIVCPDPEIFPSKGCHVAPGAPFSNILSIGPASKIVLSYG
ncbi:hypothetical protein [Sphingobacterium multivorum]|uniref:hypothetical protein n=1 Tax=Sphingobacterium multivorum TaxID=28454 RepID=UPI0031BA8F43